jgi:arylsulfatase A-like enzyme
MAAEFLGFTGRLYPTKDGTVAHYLREHSYGTYWLGKSHLTPDEASTDLGSRPLRHGGRLVQRWLSAQSDSVDDGNWQTDFGCDNPLI